MNTIVDLEEGFEEEVSLGSVGATKTETLLMCPPTLYQVSYVINPWMEGNLGNASHARATEQWEAACMTCCERGRRCCWSSRRRGLRIWCLPRTQGLEREGKVVVSSFHACGAAGGGGALSQVVCGCGV